MQRVTQATFFRQNVYDLIRLQGEMSTTNAQISTGKRITTPDVDPAASIITQPAHRSMEELEQYTSNIKFAQTWLTEADAAMAAINDQLSRAKELAEQMATGTYSGEQRSAIAAEAQSLLSQIINRANVDVSGVAVFGGSASLQAAASETLQVQTVGDVVSRAGSAGVGNLFAQGEYVGRNSRDINVTVDATPAGGTPAAGDPLTLTVSYLDDYQRLVTRTIDIEGVGAGHGVEVGDGISIYAEDRAYEAGDQFQFTVGRYRGNNEELDVNLSWSNRMNFNFTLEEVLGEEGQASPGSWSSTLDMIADWQYYLENDSKDQDFFASVPGVGNEAENRGEVRVVGDYDTLVNRDLTLTVAAVPAAGVPSLGDPITFNYSYTADDGTTVAGVVSFTGTGEDNSATLGDGQRIFISDDFFLDADAAGDNYDFTLEQYHQGQERSQQLLEELDSAKKDLLSYQAEAGSRLNRLEVRQTVSEDHYLRLNGRLTKLEDVDAAAAITEFQTLQTLYTATLQATAMVNGSTLADYI